MFAAAPPLVSLLIRYWITSEAVKFATGTSKTDLAKAALDASEQIGNLYTQRLAAAQAAPGYSPGFIPEVITGAAGVIGAPGTIAEAAGYTFEGEFARQQQRLASEIRGGLPTTRERIKGAPKFAKRQASQWNKDIKKAYATAKANKNEFGMKGKINVPKKAFPKIVKIVSDIRKGRKRKSKAGKQIKKALGYALKRKKMKGMR
jgi:hypothetical protein